MKLIWTPPAGQDLQSIVDFIAKDSPDSAARVASHILSKIEGLPSMSTIGRPGRQWMRPIVIRPWAYMVIYRLSQDAIHIIRIRHGAQSW